MKFFWSDGLQQLIKFWWQSRLQYGHRII